MRVAAHVKRAVQCQANTVCRLPALRKERRIEPAVRLKRADDRAGSAERLQSSNLFELLLLLRLRKEKIAEPRADQYIDRHAELRRLPDEIRRRRCAADDQIRAELQPVRAAAHSRLRRPERVDTDFDDRFFCHTFPPMKRAVSLQPCICSPWGCLKEPQPLQIQSAGAICAARGADAIRFLYRFPAVRSAHRKAM